MFITFKHFEHVQFIDFGKNFQQTSQLFSSNVIVFTVFYQLNYFFVGPAGRKKRESIRQRLQIDSTGSDTYVRNCFRKMLIFKLRFPSRSVISEFSFFDLRSLPGVDSFELLASRAPIFGEFCVLVAC